MLTDGREKRLFGGLLIGIFLLNCLAISLQTLYPVPLPRPIRTAASMSTISAEKGGKTENLGYIDDDQISLLWFLHVTDIHFGTDAMNPTVTNYADFLNKSYAWIKPFTIALTGDLISGQYSQELETANAKITGELANYYRVANASPYATDPNPYRYIEVAGNHDRYTDWGAAIFLNYTLSGQRLGTVQKFLHVNLSRGEILMNFLDGGGPMEAPPIPYCSEGNLDRDDMEEYVTALASYPTADTILTFHHQHPGESFGWTPTVPFRTVTQLNREFGVDAVFYGHTHMDFYETWGDTVLIMGDRFRDAYGTPDTPEFNQFQYKIVTWDSQGLNFKSAHLTQFPQVVITNPSNALFLDKKDAIHDTRGDGHVRALVFADPSDPITSVQYSLDGGDWFAMEQYGNTTVLFESDRGTPQDPAVALPADGQEHLVHVKVSTFSGKQIIEDAWVHYAPVRKPFITNALWGIFSFFGVVWIVQNRDNYPLKRADRRYRRLTHAEKVQKRMQHNLTKNKPWWLPVMGFGVLLSFLIVPVGVYPLFQGGFGAVYSWGITSSIGYTFVMEPFLFQGLKILLIFPALYWGTRTYHPELVNCGAFLTWVNGIIQIVLGYDSYGMIGLLSPSGWLDLGLGLTISIAQFKHLLIYRILKGFVTSRGPK